MNRTVSIITVVFLISLSGCQSTYYKTMEVFGRHKRDLLVKDVEQARDAQQEVKQQFQTALEKFSEVVNFSGGKLQEKYDQMKSELEKSQSRADNLRKHINDVEDVSKALFSEWESELDQYSNSEYRRISEQRLSLTRKRYEGLIGAMKRSQVKIEPVLSAFRDQVLFLKHNLNAQAVASLQDELESVKADIAVLVNDMEASIAQANAFIEEMVIN